MDFTALEVTDGFQDELVAKLHPVVEDFLHNVAVVCAKMCEQRLQWYSETASLTTACYWRQPVSPSAETMAIPSNSNVASMPLPPGVTREISTSSALNAEGHMTELDNPFVWDWDTHTSTLRAASEASTGDAHRGATAEQGAQVFDMSSMDFVREADTQAKTSDAHRGAGQKQGAQAEEFFIGSWQTLREADSQVVRIRESRTSKTSTNHLQSPSCCSTSCFQWIWASRRSCPTSEETLPLATPVLRVGQDNTCYTNNTELPQSGDVDSGEKIRGLELELDRVRRESASQFQSSQGSLERSKKAEEEKSKLIKQLQSQLDAYDRERAR